MPRLFPIVICTLMGAVPTVFAQEMPPKVVETAKVARADIARTVRLYGTVHAKREVTLLAQSDGVLDRVAMSGQAVKKGEVFATLENPELSTTYDLAKASEDMAAQQLERAKALSQSNLRSKKDLDADKARWIEATQTRLRTKLDLEKSQFKAPFDGTLGVFKVREGAYMKQGDVLVTLYDPTSLVVEFDVPAKFVPDLREKVYVDGVLYTSVKTQKIVDTQTNTSPATLDLTACARCLAGQVVNVDVVVGEAKGAIGVPKDALFMEGNQSYVYVVEKEKSIKRPVTVGLEDKMRAQILTGLKEGEVVVSVNPGRLMHEGAVRPVTS
ncbi:MAG: efflux RND transporter periplasmic adaptor subunit [Proteobacteria bacterium]|nr:efflux RND transporter periplasmic adaptor subunit [Pseudomonadota bacterium]